MKWKYILLLVSSTFLLAHSVWFSETMRVITTHEIPSGNKKGSMIFMQDDSPKVEVVIAGAPEHLTWNTQFRYTINVSDPTDGDSRFGEIDARACVMEIEYFAGPPVTEVMKAKEEHKGLTLMKRSTCFGCHADKTRLAGPSFADIAQRYTRDAVTLNVLGRHIVNGSTGIWGSQSMPSHPDLTIEQATQIADYVLTQGANKNRWIYPGLEGSFRTIEKTENNSEGVYVLTASYTSTSEVRGEHSVVLKIK